MNRSAKVACGIALCALAVSCMGTTRMLGSWTDPEYDSAPVHKVLVIGLGENVANIRSFEGAMASQLEKRGITAVLGSSIIPAGAPFDTTGGRQYCRENGIELVTITRIVGLSKETEVVPATAYYEPDRTYHRFFPYYYTSYSVVTTPGYTRQYAVVTVETNVYSMKNERLIWSGQSQAVDPISAFEAASDFAATFVRDMARCGIFGKK